MALVSLTQLARYQTHSARLLHTSHFQNLALAQTLTFHHRKNHHSAGLCHSFVFAAQRLASTTALFPYLKVSHLHQHQLLGTAGSHACLRHPLLHPKACRLYWYQPEGNTEESCLQMYLLNTRNFHHTESNRKPLAAQTKKVSSWGDLILLDNKNVKTKS